MSGGVFRSKLITRRSQVRILSPLPEYHEAPKLAAFCFSGYEKPVEPVIRGPSVRILVRLPDGRTAESPHKGLFHYTHGAVRDRNQQTAGPPFESCRGAPLPPGVSQWLWPEPHSLAATQLLPGQNSPRQFLVMVRPAQKQRSAERQPNCVRHWHKRGTKELHQPTPLSPQGVQHRITVWEFTPNLSVQALCPIICCRTCQLTDLATRSEQPRP